MYEYIILYIHVRYKLLFALNIYKCVNTRNNAEKRLDTGKAFVRINTYSHTVYLTKQESNIRPHAVTITDRHPQTLLP